MSHWLIAILGTAITFLIADGLWLGIIMKKYYMTHLAPIKRDSFKPLPAGVFYVCYTIGVVILAIEPSGAPVDPGHAFWTGALIGFLSYGTYNMTNQSTLANWPVAVSIVDWPWGTFATGLSSLAGALLYNAWLS